MSASSPDSERSETPVAQQSPEAEKLQWEINKLKAETGALQRSESASHRLVEWLKAVVGVGALVSAGVALYGLWLSDEQKRRDDHRTQLTSAFQSLSSPALPQRLYGAAFIRANFPSSTQVEQKLMLDVLVSTLAIEQEPVVRDAALSIFRAVLAQPGTEDVRSGALASLVESSRTLVRKYDLRSSRPETANAPGSPDEAIASSIGEAIVLMVRGGVPARDLSGIYCARCDFSKLRLEGTSFVDAVVPFSKFDGAQLAGADFDGADLEATSFVSANLQRASITHRQRPGATGYRKTYAQRMLERYQGAEGSKGIAAPNFNCADLRHASFEGFPLFALSSESIERRFVARTASFVRANLDGADLSEARVFGAVKLGDSSPLPLSPSYLTETPVRYFQGYIGAPGSKETVPSETDKGLAFAVGRIGAAFSATNWKAAKLPEGVRQWLTRNDPGQAPDFGFMASCKPQGT